MQILAIDPGPEKSAYVVMADGRIRAHGKVSNESLFRDGAFKGWGIDLCVIEMIASYGMPVGAEVFETCVWIGRLIERSIDFGIPAHARVTRNVVKNHLCHSSRAKDANIRQALIDRLGAPGRKATPGVTYGIAADEWAALAVALTWLDMIGRK
jgi:hypothetical protein